MKNNQPAAKEYWLSKNFLDEQANPSMKPCHSRFRIVSCLKGLSLLFAVLSTANKNNLSLRPLRLCGE
jgi:hypothetical protein